jgi:hypothetical protein
MKSIFVNTGSQFVHTKLKLIGKILEIPKFLENCTFAFTLQKKRYNQPT